MPPPSIHCDFPHDAAVGPAHGLPQQSAVNQVIDDVVEVVFEIMNGALTGISVEI